MSTIFPGSASVGQEFSGYFFDGESWNLIGNEFNPTSFSSSPPLNPKAGDLWVDSDEDVDIIDDQNLVFQNDLNDYLSLSSASTTYATKAELANIDLSSASAAVVAAIVDTAPSTLNTLNELAAALGDDENFATTVTTSLSNKLDISSASTTYLSKNEASSTYLTSASMQTVPVYVMNSGSSAQRPVSASAGMFRFNTTTGYPEWYDSITSAWYNFFQQKNISVQYLVIAGGGAGGSTGSGNFGGGGGAGGYRCSVALENSGGGGSAESPLELTPGASYTVTVGAGGVKGTSTWTNGGDSVFSTITSTGGGRGGGLTSVPSWLGPSTGGSGGGGAEGATTGAAGTGNQGFAGGNTSTFDSGAGGGGASAVGANGTSGWGGNGGAGVSSSITGTAVTRAGGGGGAGSSLQGAGGSGGGGAGGGSSSVGGNGTVNTGSGGGSGLPTGGDGGSGIVILRYPSSFTITVGAGLTSSTSTVGANKVTTFTAGTGSVSFA